MLNIKIAFMVLFVVFPTRGISGQLLPERNISSHFMEVVTFIRMFFSDDSIAFIHNENDRGLVSSILMEVGLPVDVSNYHVDYQIALKTNFVILVDDILIDDLENLLARLQFHLNSNREHKYLVILHSEDLLLTIFNMLWTNYMYNVVAVVLTPDKPTAFLTWYPYQEHSEGAIKVKPATSENPFINKVTNDMKGSNVSVGWFYYEFVMREPTNPNAAICNAFLTTFAQKRNLTLLYTRKDVYLKEFAEGENTSTMLQDMQRHTVDIALVLPIIGRICKAFDVTEGIFHTSCIWLLPRRNPIEHWIAMINIFEKDLWIAVLITVVLLSFTWWLLNYGAKNVDYNFGKSVCAIYSTMLGISLLTTPRTPKYRIMYAFCAFLLMPITNAYLGMLSSILTNPILDPRLLSVQDIAHANIKIAFYKVHMRWAVDGLDHYSRSIFETKYTPHDLRPAEQLKHYVKNPNYATIVTGFVVHNVRNENEIETLDKDHSGREMVLLLPKGHPLTRHVTQMLLQCKEVGLYNKWLKESFIDSEKLEIDVRGKYRLKPISRMDLLLAFASICVGSCIATCVFIMEIFVHRRRGG